MSSNSFSECQQRALEILNGSENVFLTGGAGTGKSYLIRQFLSEKVKTTTKGFPVLASTGAAAVLIGGRTFHSFFGLGIMEGGLEETVNKAIRNKRVVNRLNKMDGFILDEVSMIHAEALTAAEIICRLARDKEEPWGGAQVIAVGDFAQLPPINKNRSERGWAFDSPVWQKSQFVPIELKTVMRTEDSQYIKVLNFVREGKLNSEVENFLNDRALSSVSDFEGTRLFPRRHQAEAYNLQCLEKIDGPTKSFFTEYSGNQRQVEQLKKVAPVPDIIHLKKDCLVMLRQNDPKQRWVNGSLGHVREILEKCLLIELFNGRLIELEKAAFSLLDADGKTIGAAENYPINLAYASTIHKAQGSTFDRLMVNLKSLWEPGQAYVAMSRVTHGDGLVVEGWTSNSIKADPQVMRFYRDI